VSPNPIIAAAWPNASDAVAERPTRFAAERPNVTSTVAMRPHLTDLVSLTDHVSLQSRHG